MQLEMGQSLTYCSLCATGIINYPPEVWLFIVSPVLVWLLSLLVSRLASGILHIPVCEETGGVRAPAPSASWKSHVMTLTSLIIGYCQENVSVCHHLGS